MAARRSQLPSPIATQKPSQNEQNEVTQTLPPHTHCVLCRSQCGKFPRTQFSSVHQRVASRRPQMQGTQSVERYLLLGISPISLSPTPSRFLFLLSQSLSPSPPPLSRSLSLALSLRPRALRRRMPIAALAPSVAALPSSSLARRGLTLNIRGKPELKCEVCNNRYFYLLSATALFFAASSRLGHLKFSSFPARKIYGAVTNSSQEQRSLIVRAAAGESMATKVVEHIVYFKVKADTPPEKVAAFVSGLRSLESLDSVMQLHVGQHIPVPGVDNGGWTHALYGRYASQEALKQYSDSKEHVTVVVELCKPIMEDLMAVDWEVELTSPTVDPGVEVIHSAMMKIKEGTEEGAIRAMVEGLRGHEGGIPGVSQVTVGPNFAPARSKGHNWGFLSTHKTLEDLKVYATHPDHMRVMKETVYPIVESSAFVDFHIGIPPTSKI